MGATAFIRIREFCTNYGIEESFVLDLKEYEVIRIKLIDNEPHLPEEELPVNTTELFPEPLPELPVNRVDTPPPLPIEVAPKAELNKSASSLMVVSNNLQTPATVSNTLNVGDDTERTEPGPGKKSECQGVPALDGSCAASCCPR